MSNTPDSVFLQDKIGAVVVEFIADNDKFLAEYAKAFTYMITANLFYAPSANACQDMDIHTIADAPAPTELYATMTESDATVADTT